MNCSDKAATLKIVDFSIRVFSRFLGAARERARQAIVTVEVNLRFFCAFLFFFGLHPMELAYRCGIDYLALAKTERTARKSS